MNIAICDDDRKVCSFFEKKIKSIYQNANIKSFYDANEIWNIAKQESNQHQTFCYQISK